MAGFKPRVISLTKRPGHTFGFYLRAERDEEGHLIRCLEMGGPAELAGIKDGDRILRVDGIFVDGLPHSEVVTMVKDRGTSVTFHILDEASYKQAKAQEANIFGPQSKTVVNDEVKHALKPRLCYLVKSRSSFGFSLQSGNGEKGLFMNQVVPGNLAQIAGVMNKDRLLEINGENVEHSTHDQVVDKIKQAGNSLMLLLVDKATDEYYQSRHMKIGAWLATDQYLPHKPRNIDVTKGSDGYGFLLRENPKQTGHFIKDIDIGSPAEKAGMKEMDRLVAVNGKEVDDCSHEQVVDMIRQSGNKCSFIMVDKETDEMYKLGKVSPMLFCEKRKDSGSPPSYTEAINLPAVVPPSTPDQGRKEELKPKLCKMRKTSEGTFGFHLNGILGMCGQYITDVVMGGVADRAGLENDDIVLEVNGVNVEQSSHNEVVELISNSGNSLEMLVAKKGSYNQLKAKSAIPHMHLGETSYAQVHSEDTSEASMEERHEEARPETPNEPARERASSSSSEDSIDERF